VGLRAVCARRQTHPHKVNQLRTTAAAAALHNHKTQTRKRTRDRADLAGDRAVLLRVARTPGPTPATTSLRQPGLCVTTPLQTTARTRRTRRKHYASRRPRAWPGSGPLASGRRVEVARPPGCSPAPTLVGPERELLAITRRGRVATGARGPSWQVVIVEGEHREGKDPTHRRPKYNPTVVRTHNTNRRTSTPLR